jgi:hypothetical protein
MMPEWPKILLTTVAFEDLGGDKTNVRLMQIPLDASAAELACFANTMRGMHKGWGSGYALMDELLAELKLA